MRTSEYLRAARGLIDTPEKWCAKGWGSGGQPCSIAALHSAAGRGHYDPATSTVESSAFKVLRRAMDGAFPGDFNDSHTHAEVMVAFAEAIANEEAREQEFSPSACEPVAFDALPMDLVRKALDSAPFTAEEHAAWVRAWEGI